jgi:ubiquinone/menaquinone biosynthesis C-methylase UbiE
VEDDSSYFRADAEFIEEQRRLQLIEAEQDPTTIRHLCTLGVEPGWACLELGAGGGPIARWLAGRVGPRGRVVATDIDTRFVKAQDQPNLEVRRHDITRDELVGPYDLVHCRSLLVHLADREAVLRRMLDVLRPGGWLLVEENYMPLMKATDPTHPLAATFDAVYAKVFDFLATRGSSRCSGPIGCHRSSPPWGWSTTVASRWVPSFVGVSHGR